MSQIVFNLALALLANDQTTNDYIQYVQLAMTQFCILGLMLYILRQPHKAFFHADEVVRERIWDREKGDVKPEWV